VVFDELAVDEAVVDDLREHGSRQRQIRPRLRADVQIGVGRRLAFDGVDDDQFAVVPARAVGDPAIQHGMGDLRIRAPDHVGLGVGDVVVRRRRRRSRTPARTPAPPRPYRVGVGVVVPGAEAAARELSQRVRRLVRLLAASQHRDVVVPVPERLDNPHRNGPENGVPVGRPERPAPADQRFGHPLAARVDRLADPRLQVLPPVRGVVVVASNVEELPVVAGALLVATTDRAPHTGCWLPISH